MNYHILLHCSFRNEKYRDVTLKIGRKQFRVHKCLFGISSEFFNKLFTSEVCNSKLSQIKKRCMYFSLKRRICTV